MSAEYVWRGNRRFQLGTCPVCGGREGVRADGTMIAHTQYAANGRVGWGCAGHRRLARMTTHAVPRSPADRTDQPEGERP